MSFSTVGFMLDDRRTGELGDEGGVIGGAIVNDDDRYRVLLQFEHNTANKALFVEGWDDNVDPVVG
jgi:hypothetical protein